MKRFHTATLTLSLIGMLVVCGHRVASGSDILDFMPGILASAKITAPSGLAANAVSDAEIDLTWTDNSSNEAGFSIERSTSCASGFIPVGQVAGNQASYTASGLDPGTFYCFRVRAFRGKTYSVYSNTASDTTSSSGSCPVGTIGLTATAISSDAVYLSWNDVLYEDGYQIGWRQNCAGNYNFPAVMEPDATSVTLVDLPAANTEYCFVVDAWTGDPASPCWLLSEEVRATTLQATTGVLQVVNNTSYNIIDLRIDNVQQLASGQYVSPGGYWHNSLTAGTYAVYVAVGIGSTQYFSWNAVNRTVTNGNTTQYHVNLSARDVMEGEWYGVQWNTEPWTEHRIVFNSSGGYTRHTKTTGGWVFAESGTITSENWPPLSPIVSFQLSGSGAYSSCGYPFQDLYSNIAVGGGGQHLDRQ